MGTSSYFYVLHCRDGTLYGGYTTDLTRRLDEHNTGRGAKYTRPASRRPLKMIYAEEYGTKSDAMKAEAAFKKQTRRKKEVFLIEKGVRYPFSLCETTVLQEMEERNEKPKKL